MCYRTKNVYVCFHRKKEDHLKCTNGGWGCTLLGVTWVSKSILNDFATAANVVVVCCGAATEKALVREGTKRIEQLREAGDIRPVVRYNGGFKLLPDDRS